MKQGTLVRRALTEETVTYCHTKLHEYKALDVQRNVWSPVAAPYFESVEMLGLPVQVY
ncbi:hypothetical protein KIH31_03400 [Paenarthrobacter sp. DKR-5]|uniref:hypothetical protein n=1 Tax=Paenarthrobacter sp. DKR-5 TaxID=2835535 RepID=UPI001BDDC452|nr:hypothetical protein [Paenarthrobacter sp. DKR-5]MBT1001639.1 hypothetical protein [Paenarthrobacter sp. DKR-5]